jgi:hypothetical protein
MNTLDVALRYASRGLHVFPIMPAAKTPFPGTHGCKDGTTDAASIREWWTRHPDANIGVLCGLQSNLTVLDFDCKGGKRGLDTYQSLQRRFDIHTLSAETPSGGIHLFFRYVPGIQNRVDSLPNLPGLDIRNAGGYVLVAPSVVEGGPYKWTRIVAPAEMPARLVEMLQPQPKSAQMVSHIWTSNRLTLMERARRYLDVVPGAIQGRGGDVFTFKLACTLVRGFALTDSEALVLLSSWNYRCLPPWSQSELMSKIDSARRNGSEAIGSRLELAK